MRARRRLHLLLVVAVIPGCGPADRPAAADTAATADAVAPPATRAAAAPDSGVLAPCPPGGGRDALCFRAARTYDLAGDGRPFTLAVDARGPAPDSMRVALRITRGDTVLHRADWRTTLYGVYDATRPSADSTRRRVAQHLARLLADSAFRPARAFLGGASNVDAMLREAIAFDVQVDAERTRRGLAPADTLPVAAAQSPAAAADPARVRALVAELRDAPAFRYYAGGEASYVVAWSRAERRFVVVFACC